ncbi:hypothetical protein EV363DRAFT_1223969, partial [Boletus edulis]
MTWSQQRLLSQLATSDSELASGLKAMPRSAPSHLCLPRPSPRTSIHASESPPSSTHDQPDHPRPSVPVSGSSARGSQSPLNRWASKMDEDRPDRTQTNIGSASVHQNALEEGCGTPI